MVGHRKEWVEQGALFSYADNVRAMAGLRLPDISIDLKGVKPADLPVEEISEFELSHQPQDREGSRPDDPVVAAAAGGSGD